MVTGRTLANARASRLRPASQRTICPQKRRKGESWFSARGPCCHCRVVSPEKTAVRPRSKRLHGQHGHWRPPAGRVASTVAPGRARLDPRATVQRRQPGRFLRRPCRVGKKPSMLAKIG